MEQVVVLGPPVSNVNAEVIDFVIWLIIAES